MPWPKGNSGSDENKLYLEEGKIAKVLLLEDECHEIYHIHFINGKNTKCKGEGCEPCSKGTPKQERGVIKVWDLGDAKEKSLAMTPTLSRAIVTAMELCGGRQGFAFNMVMKKEGGKKAYYVQGVPSKDAPSVGISGGDAQEPDETPF